MAACQRCYMPIEDGQCVCTRHHGYKSPIYPAKAKASSRQTYRNQSRRLDKRS